MRLLHSSLVSNAARAAGFPSALTAETSNLHSYVQYEKVQPWEQQANMHMQTMPMQCRDGTEVENVPSRTASGIGKTPWVTKDDTWGSQASSPRSHVGSKCGDRLYVDGMLARSKRLAQVHKAEHTLADALQYETCIQLNGMRLASHHNLAIGSTAVPPHVHYVGL